MIRNAVLILVAFTVFVPWVRPAIGAAEEYGSVTIRVLDEAGRPVEISHVQLWTKTETGSRGFTFAASVTNEEGVYRVERVPVGSYRGLKINKQGYAPYWVPEPTIDVGQHRLIVCTLSRGGRIDGLVTDETGRPLSGIPVVVNSVGCRRDVVTDANGRFLAEHLSFDTRYSVIAEPQPGSPYAPAVLKGGAVTGAHDVRIVVRSLPEGDDRDRRVIRREPTQRSAIPDTQLVERAGLQSTRSQINGLVGRTAPPLVVERWYGGSFWELDLKRKVILLDFWGVWCGPCKRQIPLLIRLSKQYGPKGLAVVGVHTALQKEFLGKFISEKRIPYVVGVDHLDRTAEMYQVRGYPTVFVIDRRGTIRSVDPSDAELEKLIELLLNE